MARRCADSFEHVRSNRDQRHHRGPPRQSLCGARVDECHKLTKQAPPQFSLELTQQMAEKLNNHKHHHAGATGMTTTGDCEYCGLTSPAAPLAAPWASRAAPLAEPMPWSRAPCAELAAPEALPWAWSAAPPACHNSQTHSLARLAASQICAHAWTVRNLNSKIAVSASQTAAHRNGRHR